MIIDKLYANAKLGLEETDSSNGWARTGAKQLQQRCSRARCGKEIADVTRRKILIVLKACSGMVSRSWIYRNSFDALGQVVYKDRSLSCRL